MPRSGAWDKGLSPAELGLSEGAAEVMRAELPKMD